MGLSARPAATASGAPIGLELFVNGDASSATGLTLSNASISAGQFIVGHPGYVECDAIQALVPGTYHCTIDDPNDDEGIVNLTMGGGSAVVVSFDLGGGHYACDYVIGATPANNKLRITNSDAFNEILDNISIKRTA